MVKWSRRSKTSIFFLISLIFLSLLFYVLSTKYYHTGYAVRMNSIELGISLEPRNIYAEYERILFESRKDQEHLEFVEQPRLQFVEVNGWFLEENYEQIIKQMHTLIKDEIEAWQITVDGEPIGTVGHKLSANQLLLRLKSAYESSDNEKTTFKEKVSIEKVRTTPIELTKIDSMWDKMLQTVSPAAIHQVTEGDTIGEIANQHSLTTEEIIDLNPTINEAIKPGDTIMISPEERTINVFSKTTLKQKITIPYEIVRLPYSPGVKSREGQVGMKSVTYLIEKMNGSEIERAVLREDVDKEPLNKIVIEKRAEVQAASVLYESKQKSTAGSIEGSGFNWPADGGIITSKYGMRGAKCIKESILPELRA